MPASSTQHAIAVDHIRIESTKPFAAVEAALERLIPPLDPKIVLALRGGDR